MPVNTISSDKFLETKDKYILCLCNCISTKINGEEEPSVTQLYSKFPYANLYKDRGVSGKNGKPGEIEVRGGGAERYVINLVTQFYPGKNKFPNDNPNKRLSWFKKGLDKISDLNNLNTISISRDMVEEVGGEWEKYYQALADFEKTLCLKNKKKRVTVNIYVSGKYSSSEESKKSSDKNYILSSEKTIDLVKLSNITEETLTLKDLQKIVSESKNITEEIEDKTSKKEESVTERKSQTANGKYLFDKNFFGKELKVWVQESHRELSKASGWFYRALVPGQFGFDNMAMSVGLTLEKLESGSLTEITEEVLADLIHQGWSINYLYWRNNKPWNTTNSPYKKPSKTLNDKRRNECASTNYVDLPDDEKEKDLILARYLIKSLEGKTKTTTTKTIKKKAPSPVKSIKKISKITTKISKVKPVQKIKKEPEETKVEKEVEEQETAEPAEPAEPTEPAEPAEPEEETNDESIMPVYEANPDWKKPVSELIEDVTGWHKVFIDSKIQNELRTIDEKFEKEMEVFGDFVQILPSPQQIFNSFKLCPFSNLKVVIIGQDPYYANVGEAMGLSFSVPDGIKIPPSLLNIFKELKTDIPGFTIPKSGNLTEWAEKGVLLLNAALTVRHKKSEAHMNIWKGFTDRIIELISTKSEHPVVFMLWGLFAKRKQNLINTSKHIILTSNHPSPLSANKGGWFGSKHFSKANEELKKIGIDEIDWSL